MLRVRCLRAWCRRGWAGQEGGYGRQPRDDSGRPPTTGRGTVGRGRLSTGSRFGRRRSLSTERGVQLDYSRQDRIVRRSESAETYQKTSELFRFWTILYEKNEKYKNLVHLFPARVRREVRVVHDEEDAQALPGIRDQRSKIKLRRPKTRPRRDDPLDLLGEVGVAVAGERVEQLLVGDIGGPRAEKIFLKICNSITLVSLIS